MPFSALDRYYVKLFEVNLDFLFFIVRKRLNNIPWNKLRAVPSILHTVGVNWDSRSEIDTAGLSTLTYFSTCPFGQLTKKVLVRLNLLVV
jgi:hypothetical protein